MIPGLATAYLLMIALSAVGVRLAARLRRRSGRPFLRTFQAYVVLTFAYALLSFVGEGVSFPALRGAHESLERISVVVDLFTIPVLGATLGLLVLWVVRLRFEKEPKIARFAPPIIAALFLAVASADLVAWFGGGGRGVAAIGARLVQAVAAAAALASVLLLLTGGMRRARTETHGRLPLFLGILYAVSFGTLAALYDNPGVLRHPSGLGFALVSGLFVLVNFPALLYLNHALARGDAGAGEAVPGGPGWAERALAAGLTEREREIVELVAAGKHNREIGTVLFISPKTVKNHISSVYSKTGLRNRVELANLYRDPGPRA